MDLLEIKWLGLTFLCGLAARRLGQPPLTGFLVAGFLLAALGVQGGSSLDQLSKLGIKLLLFLIGLKLDLRRILRTEVWGSTLAHMSATTALFGALALGAGVVGLPLFRDLDLWGAALLGFAASFSSTVFVVKLLEDRDDVAAFYGRVAVGALIVQDIVAVVFLGAAAGKVPTIWAPLLLGWWFARPVVHWLLVRAGHGEVLVMAGIVLTLLGSWTFELVGVKGDLGALALGVVAAGHTKSNELGKAMHGVTDLFLVGFFLTVGLAGLPTLASTAAAGMVLLLIPVKVALFFALFLGLRIRARSSLFASTSLGNYSEFGLIVASVAVGEGWLDGEWLVALALAMAGSFVLGSLLDAPTYAFYERRGSELCRLERPERLPDEQAVDAGFARVLVIGMGRVGAAAYDVLVERFGEAVVGLDVDANKVSRHLDAGRRVILASATDADFWDRLQLDLDRLELVVLAMASVGENTLAIRYLRQRRCQVMITATARFPDELDDLEEAGADLAVHVMAEAGRGMAHDALRALERAQPAVAS